MAKREDQSIESRLLRSMEQAVAISKGTAKPRKAYSEPFTARDVTVAPAPRFDAARIIRIRTRLNASQPVFASALNVSLGTVRAWEQGARVPDGPSLRLLELAERHPDVILENLHAAGSLAGKGNGAGKIDRRRSPSAGQPARR